MATIAVIGLAGVGAFANLGGRTAASIGGATQASSDFRSPRVGGRQQAMLTPVVDGSSNSSTSDTPSSARSKIRALATALTNGKYHQQESASQMFYALLEQIEAEEMSDAQVEELAASLIEQLSRRNYRSEEAFRSGNALQALTRISVLLGYDPRFAYELAGQARKLPGGALRRDLRGAVYAHESIPLTAHLMAQCQRFGLASCEEALSLEVRQQLVDDFYFRIYPRTASNYDSTTVIARLVDVIERYAIKYEGVESSAEAAALLRTFSASGVGKTPRLTDGNIYNKLEATYMENKRWEKPSIVFLRRAGLSDEVARIAGNYDSSARSWVPAVAEIFKRDAAWLTRAVETEKTFLFFFKRHPFENELADAIKQAGSPEAVDIESFMADFEHKYMN